MKQHKLSKEQVINVADHIAKRSLINIAPGCDKEALERYLETYNRVLNNLEAYNNNIRD